MNIEWIRFVDHIGIIQVQKNDIYFVQLISQVSITFVEMNKVKKSFIIGLDIKLGVNQNGYSGNQ